MARPQNLVGLLKKSVADANYSVRTIFFNRPHVLVTYWPHAWLAIWIVLSLGAAFFAGTDHRLDQTLKPPSLANGFGCDAFGRDLFSVVLLGASKSMLFSLLVVVGAFLIGTSLGASIEFLPNWAKTLSLRFLDFLLSFPYLLLSLGFAAIAGPGWDTLIFALSVGIIPSFVRLIHVRSKEICAETYVLASVSLGAHAIQTVRSHLFPALMQFSAIKIPNLFANALIAEASLSFIGMGAPVGEESWGTLLAQGKDYLVEAPHIAFVSGVPLVLTIMALQRVSESWFEFREYDV